MNTQEAEQILVAKRERDKREAEAEEIAYRARMAAEGEKRREYARTRDEQDTAEVARVLVALMQVCDTLNDLGDVPLMRVNDQAGPLLRYVANKMLGNARERQEALRAEIESRKLRGF